MSEHKPSHSEKLVDYENLVDDKNLEKVHENITNEAEKSRIENSENNIAKIREMAKTEAEEASKVKLEQSQESETDSLVGMQGDLKSTAYARTLAKIQMKLSKPNKSFSKAVHSPLVDKVSNATAQTIARPSGILGGSLVAFAGSCVLLYFSKHYGFKYNYLVALGLFVGGYVLGSLLELVTWSLFGRKQRY